MNMGLTLDLLHNCHSSVRMVKFLSVQKKGSWEKISMSAAFMSR